MSDFRNLNIFKDYFKNKVYNWKDFLNHLIGKYKNFYLINSITDIDEIHTQLQTLLKGNTVLNEKEEIIINFRELSEELAVEKLKTKFSNFTLEEHSEIFEKKVESYIKQIKKFKR